MRRPSGATDWDLDGHPGLTIKSSDLKATEPDPRKFQTWSYAVPGGGLGLHGPMSLSLWSSPQFKKDQDVDYSAWVYSCDGLGLTCQLLTSAVKVHVTKWSTTTTWERRTIPLGSVSTNAGRGPDPAGAAGVRQAATSGCRWTRPTPRR